MEIVEAREGQQLRYPHAVLTVGNFDGVHLGHQALFRLVVVRARQAGGTAIALTFEPHPRQILAPHAAPPLLTSFEEKAQLIATCGIDVLVWTRFTHAFAEQRPREFVRARLVEALAPREVVVGHDFRFGKDRAGDVVLLGKLGSEFGFRVHVVGPVAVGDVTASSSVIRTLIREGRVGEAATLLGRPYVIAGRVVEGRKRGKGLGFPTANIEPTSELIPPFGVYAARLTAKGEERPAVVNIGRNPTFEDVTCSIEAHVLDYAGDLYGEPVTLAFIERIRDEQKFPSPQALVEQIHRDVARARRLLGQAEVPAPA